jgi:hypothetical protein
MTRGDIEKNIKKIIETQLHLHRIREPHHHKEDDALLQTPSRMVDFDNRTTPHGLPERHGGCHALIRAPNNLF